MIRLLPVLLTTVAVVILSGQVLAEETKRPGSPGPEMMFKRLDRNQDGKVAADEVPDWARHLAARMLPLADEARELADRI